MAIQTLTHTKLLSVAGVVYAMTANTELSNWMMDGQPSGGAVPTTWANPTNTTIGSLMQSNPAAGRQQWLKDLVAATPVNTNANSRLVLYDRLGHCGSLSGTTTTAQNVNGGSPGTVTRWSPNYSGLYTNPDAITGDGNEIFMEVYTSVGATPQTVTATYTNSVGTSGQVTQAVTLNRINGQCTRLPLAAGDTGVQSVTSVTLSGSTGTAGNFGITIAHRICELTPSGGMCPEVYHPLFAGSAQEMAEVLSGTCFWWTLVASTAATTFTTVRAFFTLVDN